MDTCDKCKGEGRFLVLGTLRYVLCMTCRGTGRVPESKSPEVEKGAETMSDQPVGRPEPTKAVGDMTLEEYKVEVLAECEYWRDSRWTNAFQRQLMNKLYNLYSADAEAFQKLYDTR